MALKLKYTDEHGILHINMSPSSTPRENNTRENNTSDKKQQLDKNLNPMKRTVAYDILSSKIDTDSSGDLERTSLFRSRYNSVEEELANTPYAFTNRFSNNLDISIKNRLLDSPSKDIEDDRFFNRNLNLECDSLFGPQLDFETSYSSNEESPAFTVKQLIHAQDRYFDLSSRQSNYTDSITKSEPDSKKERSNFETKINKKVSDSNFKKEPPISLVRTVPVKSDVSVSDFENRSKGRTFENRKEKDVKRTVKIFDRVASSVEKSGDFSKKDGAFKVLLVDSEKGVKAVQEVERATPTLPVLPTSKRKRESSFVIIADTPSRPSSPKSLPLETRSGRISPFRGRGFREDTSRHTTPRTSAANSRACSPNRRRTSSLSRIDTMAQIATLPAFHIRPHSPRNFVKENIKEVQELSELNREKHEAEAERMRQEEEEALLREMGLLDKDAKGSKSNSRASSPGKISKLRSRSNSPTAVVQYEVPINDDDGNKTVERKSRVQSVSKSQPQSNNGSPTHSKIPKRQGSVSPTRTGNRKVENKLNKNQRFISNSTSSINESIKIGSSVHDKRGKSQSTVNLNISPAHIRGKPPISPMKYGPPPTNVAINPKRLSPIVGTPNKSPDTNSKPNSSRTPKTPIKKTVKTVVNSGPIKTNVKAATKIVNRDPSPDKRKVLPKETKPVNRTASNRVSKPVNVNNNKPEIKKPISRTSSVKSLVRAPSTKTLNEKATPLHKVDSKKDLRAKAQSTNKINEVGTKMNGNANGKIIKDKDTTKPIVPAKPEKVNGSLKSEQAVVATEIEPETVDVTKNHTDDVQTQDNETQYDKMTYDKDELVIMTKKNIVSMTTAAITSQPLDVVTTVTNQLPAAFEKAREKGIFERHSSKESLGTKTNDDNETTDDKTSETPKGSKVKELKTIFSEENVKLKPLQPPYNNPQVERVKQKIDDILKSPEVSSENILATAAAEVKEAKSKFKNIADKTKNDIKQTKNEITNKFTDIKEQALKQNAKFTEEIRSEATKIVDSIITPVEEPVEVKRSPKEAPKKEIEPIVMVVNERKTPKSDFRENITQTLVKGEADVENQSLNNMTTGQNKMALKNNMADGGSDRSSQSNGGLPQSTSTTPKPPERQKRAKNSPQNQNNESKMAATDDPSVPPKKETIAKRILSKCAKGTKCCACCVKPEDDEQEKKDGVEKKEGIQDGGEKKSILSKMNCCKGKDAEVKEQMAKEIEKASGKAIIAIESEIKPKRKLRDVLCCRARRVSDSSVLDAVRVEESKVADAAKVMDVDDEIPAGCCGRRKMNMRRDSILSDSSMTTCCNNRVANWFRGKCRRRSEIPVSRRPSMFSKNKSLSPTLPPEDTRPKLDASLLEHTSFMRAAIPVLKVPLAAICLVANVVVPGLGTILSGLFCLCFGIPRFGVHDGAKYRIGGLLVNLIVGCFQLFTVIFCLVGWGWSIWWGVIMIRLARKYRKLKQEAAQALEEEPSSSPPLTDGNLAPPPA